MQQRDAQVVYRVPRSRRGWELSEETMPESVLHDEAVELLKAILAWWARGRESTFVARNLAIRWDEDEPRIGVDPDVCVLSPAPPDVRSLRSVRTWIDGHEPPMVAFEVVSETNPRKDYVIAPDKYAASGTRELCIFDPQLSGPSAHGGPVRLQLWERDDQGGFVRTYAGDGPCRSRALDAHLVVEDDGTKLRICGGADGSEPWPTGEEASREREQASRDREQASRDREEASRDREQAALARVAELEAALRERE